MVHLSNVRSCVALLGVNFLVLTFGLLADPITGPAIADQCSDGWYCQGLVGFCLGSMVTWQTFLEYRACQSYSADVCMDVPWVVSKMPES